MDSSKFSPLNSFKHKKPPHSPSGEKTRKTLEFDSNPWRVETPGKPVDPPRRLRHRSAAMSIKEVRQAAMKLRERGPEQNVQAGLVAGSTNEHLESWTESAGSTKMKKKSANSEIKLPEKYELLDKFFNSLDSSIRLLQLKRAAPTFTNVSTQVESLTDRRFTHNHLAQLKFIMPEGIEIEKVLQHDERTSCMKPDLRITLNVKAIESERNSKSESRNLQLRKVFRARLLDFLKSHPEGDEVPEEALPEPFGRLKEDARRNSVNASASSSMSEKPDEILSRGEPVAASHLSLSFRRSFSQRRSANCTEDLKQENSVITVHDSVEPEPKFTENLSEKVTSAFAAESPSKISLKPTNRAKCSSNGASSVHIPPSSPLETPVKSINSAKNENCFPTVTAATLRTPEDLSSTPAKLMSATPMLQPPRRCYMSPKDDSSGSPSKLVRRQPPNRPLKFDTPVKNTKVDDELSRGNLSAGDGILDILPEALLQSIREKEKKVAMEQDPAISQAKWRQQMIASLPKIFDMIYFLFQSIRRSVVTKEELIQKIIAGHLDVVDRREVEEQLRLLQELAPDWIFEKSASSGDLLLCVNKISSPDVIRSRLAEAI